MDNSVVYRPCTVDGQNALFHRWVDKEDLFFNFDGVCEKGKLSEAVNSISSNVIPSGINVNKVKKTLAIVELEDGSVHEVRPTSIKFLDGNRMFHDNEFFFKMYNEKRNEDYDQLYDQVWMLLSSGYSIEAISQKVHMDLSELDVIFNEWKEHEGGKI